MTAAVALVVIFVVMLAALVVAVARLSVLRHRNGILQQTVDRYASSQYDMLAEHSADYARRKAHEEEMQVARSLIDVLSVAAGRDVHLPDSKAEGSAQAARDDSIAPSLDGHSWVRRGDLPQ